MSGRQLVIIESPFAATSCRSQREHEDYLHAALRDSWSRGEIPFASHGFFPRFLDDNDAHERKEGIEAGYTFWQYAKVIAFYIDYGLSPGMQMAWNRAAEIGMPTVTRKVF